MNSTVKDIPKYGFKVRMDHEFPEKWSQKIRPKLKQTIQMLPLAWRQVSIIMIIYLKIDRKKKLSSR